MAGGAHGMHHRVQGADPPLLHHHLIGGSALLQARRHRYVGQRRPQSQCVRPRGRLGLVDDAAAAQIVDQTALRPKLQ